MGGKFTVFLEIKKSEIKNQNRKKDNSHIIGNRKAKSGNPKAKIQKRKAKKRQPVSKAKSENPKAKSENFFRVAEPVDFFCQRGFLDQHSGLVNTKGKSIAS